MNNIKWWVREHEEATIGIVVSIIILSFIMFLAVPVKDSMMVEATWWTWEIPIEVYTAKEFDSLSRPPKDAYDVRAETEIYYETERHYIYDSNGNGSAYEERIPRTRTRYYYKRNVWIFSYNLTSSGVDKKPYEAKCDIPSIVPNPNVGDKRRLDHKEIYEVVGSEEDKTRKFKVSKNDWQLIDIDGMIYYKRFRFGVKIWNVKFEEEK